MEKKNIFAKFSLKWALGAMLIAGALVTGCKNYDDEISDINEEIERLRQIVNDLGNMAGVVTNVEPIENGWRITYSTGQTKDITADPNLGGITVTLGPNGDYYIMQTPVGTVLLPITMIKVETVEFIPKQVDVTTNQPMIAFSSLTINNPKSAATKMQGLTEVQYRVSPTGVKANSFRVKGYVSTVTQTLAAKPMMTVIDTAIFDEETDILSVFVAFSKDGASAPGDPVGNEQDKLSLVIENILEAGDSIRVLNEVPSGYVLARNNASLILDSTVIYDKSKLGDVKHQALLFAWDSLGGRKVAEFKSTDTHVADYATIAGGDGSDAESFAINLRDPSTVAKKYLSTYDMGAQVAMYDSTAADAYKILTKDRGFLPTYEFDTLKSDDATESAFLAGKISKAGVISFPQFASAQLAYEPAIKIVAKINGRVVDWGAVKLDLSEEAPALTYEKGKADLGSYAIKSWNNDTVWMGELADMLTKVGLTKEEFAANYELNSVTYAANTVSPIGASDAAGSFSAIVEKGQFGVIVGKDAPVKSAAYAPTFKFVDKSGDPDGYGEITVKLTLKLTYPDISSMTWTKNASRWLGDNVVVDGKVVSDTWEMVAPMSSIWTEDSYKFPAGLTALAPKANWVWSAWDGKKINGSDSIAWNATTVDQIELVRGGGDSVYLNKSKGLKVDVLVPLANHGSVISTSNGTTFTSSGSGAGSHAIRLFKQLVDVFFGMPVAPLALSGVSLEMKGGAADSLYLLNAVKLTNYEFGQQAGDVQLIKPAENFRKQVSFDTAWVDIFEISTGGDLEGSESIRATFTLKDASLASDFDINSDTGLLKFKGGINPTSDQTVIVVVEILNKWNDGEVGNEATRKAVLLEVPVTIKSNLK